MKKNEFEKLKEDNNVAAKYMVRHNFELLIDKSSDKVLEESENNIHICGDHELWSNKY